MKQKDYTREELPATTPMCRYYKKRCWIDIRTVLPDGRYEYRHVVDGVRPRNFYWGEFPKSDLSTCDNCGRLGGKRKVRYRSDVDGYNVPDKDDHRYWLDHAKRYLCCGCWNRAKAIVRKDEQIKECKSLINQITKEISRERKQREQDGTDDGRPAGLSGEHDGRREERHA